MCRHLAYLGPPATLRSVVIEPPHGLYTQSWAPRRQRHGTVNADGFGVGWYAGGDPVPARYRQTGPIWGDESFADVARVTRAGAILAVVRDATAGTDPGLAAVTPFAAGCWLFSHNGVIDGWPDSTAALAGTLDAGSLLALPARVTRATSAKDSSPQIGPVCRYLAGTGSPSAYQPMPNPSAFTVPCRCRRGAQDWVYRPCGGSMITERSVAGGPR